MRNLQQTIEKAPENCYNNYNYALFYLLTQAAEFSVSETYDSDADGSRDPRTEGECVC